MYHYSSVLFIIIPACSGYSIVPYELFQVPASQSASTSIGISSFYSQDQSKTDSVQTSPSKKNVTFSSGKKSEKSEKSEKSVKSETAPEATEEGIKRSSPLQMAAQKEQTPSPSPSNASHRNPSDEEEDLIKISSSTSIEMHSNPASPQPRRKRSGSVYVGSASLQSKSVVLSKSEDSSRFFGPKEAEFLESLIDPGVITSKDGRAVVKGLFLPPPPTPDISHILSPSPTRTTSKSSSKASLSLKSPTSSQSTVSRQTTPSHDSGDRSSSRKSPQSSLRKKPGSQLAKEKLLQPKREKFCLSGMCIV